MRCAVHSQSVLTFHPGIHGRVPNIPPAEQLQTLFSAHVCEGDGWVGGVADGMDGMGCIRDITEGVTVGVVRKQV